MLRRPKPRRALLGETPPPPKEPIFPTAADTEAYLVWLKARVSELDSAVQAFVPTMPERVVAGTLTPGQALALAANASGWNAWVLAWNQHAKNLSEQSWASMVKWHVELEEWRSRFRKNGMSSVPESTSVPQGGISKPGGGIEQAADKFGTYLAIGLVVVGGVVAYKVFA